MLAGVVTAAATREESERLLAGGVVVPSDAYAHHVLSALLRIEAALADRAGGDGAQPPTPQGPQPAPKRRRR